MAHRALPGKPRLWLIVPSGLTVFWLILIFWGDKFRNINNTKSTKRQFISTNPLRVLSQLWHFSRFWCRFQHFSWFRHSSTPSVGLSLFLAKWEFAQSQHWLAQSCNSQTERGIDRISCSVLEMTLHEVRIVMCLWESWHHSSTFHGNSCLLLC